MLSGPRFPLVDVPHLRMGNDARAKNIRKSAENCIKVVLIIRMGCRTVTLDEKWKQMM